MLRVVLTGPECTGKTTLTEKLSHFYGIPFVPEFAVDYLNNKKNKEEKYTLGDLKMIAEGQTFSENMALLNTSVQKKELTLCDTDILTIKIWADVVFGKKDETIESFVNVFAKGRKKENIYLLSSPEGIAWEAHPLRENPNDRDKLFGLYERLLKKQKVKYFILKGDLETRFDGAIKIIDKAYSKALNAKINKDLMKKLI